MFENKPVAQITQNSSKKGLKKSKIRRISKIVKQLENFWAKSQIHSNKVCISQSYFYNPITNNISIK